MKSTMSTIKQTGASFGEFVTTLAAFLLINALLVAPALAIIHELVNRIG